MVVVRVWVVTTEEVSEVVTLVWVAATLVVTVEVWVESLQQEEIHL